MPQTIAGCVDEATVTVGFGAIEGSGELTYTEGDDADGGVVLGRAVTTQGTGKAPLRVDAVILV